MTCQWAVNETQSQKAVKKQVTLLYQSSEWKVELKERVYGRKMEHRATVLTTVLDKLRAITNKCIKDGGLDRGHQLCHLCVKVDVCRTWTTMVTLVLFSHPTTRDNSRCSLLKQKGKINKWNCCKVFQGNFFQLKINFKFDWRASSWSLLEDWSGTGLGFNWSVHGDWLFEEPCHMLVLDHCVFLSPRSV